MTDRELKHLGKADLIEIIYQMKKNEIELRNELNKTQKKLEARDLKIQNAGSIAEAVVSINDLFETAQKTANEYLEQILVAKTESESRCREMEEETRIKCERIEQETEQSIAKKWAEFNKKTEDSISSQNELGKTGKEIQ